jgi:outer membrane protein OmpA-like peptidoglycan-associated protein
VPEKPPKKDPNKLEERWVTWSDLETGVHIKKAGHPVILFIGGHAPPGTETTDDPDSTTTAGPGSTTTAGPGETTTKGPGETTTKSPGESTTKGPDATTTKGPDATTTKGPDATTTKGPDATTTKGPDATTTKGPGETTTKGPDATTTKGPDATTTKATVSTTTTAPPSTTTIPAPSTTTTAPPSTTTTAPPSTTTTASKKSKKTQFGAEHFETAKSFPLPADGSLDTFRKIAALSNKEPDRQLLILGHTDTAGTDSYNVKLSNERALSIRAYLLNDVDSWYAWYSNADAQKKWGLREDQYMLSALPYDSDPKFYARQVTGTQNADFTAALKKFQSSVGEPATGTVNAATRKKLILAYMQAEGTSVPSGTTIETQGCGFRNLAKQTAKGVSEAANRRTEVYAFAGAITPDQSAWADDNKGTYKAWEASVEGDFE